MKTPDFVSCGIYALAASMAVSGALLVNANTRLVAMDERGASFRWKDSTTRTMPADLGTRRHGEHNREMEDRMKQTLAALEAELEHVAETHMTDRAFAECRDDENMWITTAADGLDRAA